MLKLAVLMLVLAGLTGEDDKFLPPRIDHLQAVGCEVVADKIDQQAYVEVYGKHDSEPGWDYRVVIARRDSPEQAMEDCRKWYEDLKHALTKERDNHK